MSDEQVVEEKPAGLPKGIVKAFAAGAAVAIVVLLLLNRPPREITINPPELRHEPTAEAYIANLDVIAGYAEQLKARKQHHPKFRRLRFADYAEMKEGAKRLAESSPSVAEDQAMWAESQRMAGELFIQFLEVKSEWLDG